MAQAWLSPSRVHTDRLCVHPVSLQGPKPGPSISLHPQPPWQNSSWTPGSLLLLWLLLAMPAACASFQARGQTLATAMTAAPRGNSLPAYFLKHMSSFLKSTFVFFLMFYCESFQTHSKVERIITYIPTTRFCS